ncbi:DUF1304 family protein [Deinococcus sonorensis]
MVLWTALRTRAALGTTPEVAQATHVLDNGFLVVGLVWSLLALPPLARPLRLFFSGGVRVAGLYGGATVLPRIHAVQVQCCAAGPGLRV